MNGGGDASSKLNKCVGTNVERTHTVDMTKINQTIALVDKDYSVVLQWILPGLLHRDVLVMLI